MTDRTPGLHHVTCVAADMQRTLDFYTGTLGLRLVKRTVNFDDPTAHHCYVGDGAGTPGSLLSFFSWSESVPARSGTGQARTIALRAPGDSLDYWHDRLTERGVVVDGPYERFDERVLAFRDPDGLELEIVLRPDGGTSASADDAGLVPWSGGPVPEEAALRGIDGITLSVASLDPTAEFLGAIGYDRDGSDRERVRFRAASERAPIADVIESPGARIGRSGAGGIHHVAVRVPDDPTMEAYREALVEQGRHVTAVIDRHYFRSVYVQEPGGVLFEAATENPGLDLDEDPGSLGSTLSLPPWLEGERESIVASLPEIEAPTGGVPGAE